MVREVGQPPGAVDLLAGGAVHLGDGARAAAEDAHLADVAVLPLHEAEKGDHVRPPEVVGRLQVGEQAAPGQALEVVLADVLEREEGEGEG